jgi:hypothetical protein
MGNTLKSWMKAKKLLAETEQTVCQAKIILREAAKRHRLKYPLNQETKEVLFNAHKNGNPLCCAKGRKTLTDAGLDEYWVEYLNDWAYGSLGCTKSDQPGGCAYENGLNALHDKLYENGSKEAFKR